MIDIPSLLMGKALGSDGGGGGGDNLFSSGWIMSYGTLAEIDENTVTFSPGGSSHQIYIGPPANVRRNHAVTNEDTLVIAINVKSTTLSIGFNGGSATVTQSGSQWTFQANGLGNTNKTGKSVLTYKPDGSQIIGIRLFAGNNNSDFNSAEGVIEITGLKFNDMLIFGDVTPPSA